MIDFFTWILLVLGGTYLITCSFVAAFPRMLVARLGSFLKYLVYCPWCMAFHVGWILGCLKFGFATETIVPILGSGVSAMGLIVLVKGIAPNALVPPYEAEQGEGDRIDAELSEEERLKRNPRDRQMPAPLLVSNAEARGPCDHKYASGTCLKCGRAEE